MWRNGCELQPAISGHSTVTGSSLYKDKYYYMGDADLMSAALLTGCEQSDYIGLGRGSLSRHQNAKNSLIFPFSGIGGKAGRKHDEFFL